MKYSYRKYPLHFAFDARTSRGAIQTHTAYIIEVSDGVKTGLGEASPLTGLSIDAVPEFESYLQDCLAQLTEGKKLAHLDLVNWPALKFGLETAIQDFENGGLKIFETNHWLMGKPLPINGLVWMNEIPSMFAQAISKVNEGYTHIKFKVGALQFDDECEMLYHFRKKFDAATIQIRLDANGAFALDEVQYKLTELSKFGIHSIEQPIQKGNWEAMAETIAHSPISIALDEELIGVDVWNQGATLMKICKPAFLILKPTLIGGIANANEWIRLAQSFGKDWWATSALESNIGLNRIAQWCSSTLNPMPQGLGTGSLYTNNFVAPFEAKAGMLSYDKTRTWQLPF